MAIENTSPGKTFRSTVGGMSVDVHIAGDTASADGLDYEIRRAADGSLIISTGGATHLVVPEMAADGSVVIWIDGHRIPVDVHDDRDRLLERYGIQSSEAHRHHQLSAPMPGLVVRVMVDEGAEVSKGDNLIVLEAMKMENEIRADADGVVSRIHVSAGDAVSKNAVLIEFES